MNILRLLPAASATLLLAAACSSETYDNVPIDVSYTSNAAANFSVTLADGSEHLVEQFGLAIGYTRIELCEDDAHASRLHPSRWFALPVAHAHSPSTPTSSGIPVILSTLSDDDAPYEDLIEAALRPVRGGDVCAVEVQLLNSDHDAHMLEYFPEIEGCASAAIIDGDKICTQAGPPVRFPVDPPLHMDGEIQFRITLDEEAWQTNLDALAFEDIADTKNLGDALQDAGMDALRFEYAQHIPAE